MSGWGHGDDDDDDDDNDNDELNKRMHCCFLAWIFFSVVLVHTESCTRGKITSGENATVPHGTSMVMVMVTVMVMYIRCWKTL